jgi:transposase
MVLPRRIAANEKPRGGVDGDALKDSDQAASAGRLVAIASCWIEKGPDKPISRNLLTTTVWKSSRMDTSSATLSQSRASWRQRCQDEHRSAHPSRPIALGSGLGVRAVAGMLKGSSSYVQRWRKRFLASRLAGLVARHQGRQVRRDAAKLEARILEWTRRGPQDGTTPWSSRRLAAQLGTNHMTISRVWARHGLQPHRLRRYMLSEDPSFEKKAADIIGLYLAPPDHAAVFCVDEKTAIQALDRLDPVLPLSPGRAEAHGFEYDRHGTLSLYAALDTRSGEILGKTAQRHTSTEFVDFLASVVASPAPETRDPRHCR